MSCVQRLCHLDTQRDRGRDIQGLTVDVLAKGLTVEQFHHQKGMASRLADVINRANIGMIQRRSGLCLSLETLSRGLRCKGRGRILTATWRCNRVSRALYTSPMPPLPMAEKFRTG